MTAQPNFGGRKKGSTNKFTGELRAAFSPYMPELIERLIKLTKHKNPDISLRAIKECFDRGVGKAPQSVEVAGPAGGAIPVQLTISELSRRLLLLFRLALEAEKDAEAKQDY